ncbi:hypothetical protein GCM10028819_25770 [Spirosoma humi]
MQTRTKGGLTSIARLLALLLLTGITTGVRAQLTSDLPLSITILYFDQSSPQLRPNVKTMLDSIAQQLVAKPNLVATVTGYTDTIGRRELNRVLAERRAKAVEAYLKQQGASANQIKASWEGPDKNAPADDPQAVKTISRRVVVQLSPR